MVEVLSKFEINEDEFISLGKYHGSIQVKVKSGGDFSKNGISGFMLMNRLKLYLTNF